MKRLALIVAMLFVTTYASAGLKPTFKFGVKVGMDYQANNFKSAISDFDIHSNTGWFAGAVADLSWGKWGIHPEIVYTRNSFSVDGINEPLKVSNLEVPLLFNYNVLNFLSLQVGPRFCVMDDANCDIEGVEWNWDAPTIGYALGVEAKVWRLAISARYNGAFKRTEVMGFTTGKNSNNNLQIGIGYYF